MKYMAPEEVNKLLNALGKKKWNIVSELYSTHKENIRNCIEDKEKRKGLGLVNSRILELILVIGDIDYIKSIIENKDKIENLNLSKWGIKELIKATKDNNYIKNIIGNKEKREELGLTSINIFKMIKCIEDAKYLESILKDKEKIHELDLTTSELITLIESIGKKEHFSILAKTLEQGKMEFDYRQKIKLPANMTIGIEIESEGENSFFINHLSNIIADGWICKSDETLKDGAEVVSPILTGDTEKTTHQIKYVCQRLNRLRTNCNQKMWRTYSCWCRLFNN